MQQPATTTAPASLWRSQRFLVFWGGQAISQIGSSMAMLALPLLVLQTTGSVARMGLVTALIAVGSVLAGVLSGMLVDHLNRRLFMLSCDALSAVLYASIPLFLNVVGAQGLLLYLLAAPLGFLAVSSTVAAQASLPHLVERGQLTQANAGYQICLALAFLVGPLLAGSLTPLVGAPTLMGLNALSYLVSVLSLVAIRLRPASDEPDQPTPTGAIGEWVAGVRFLLVDARVRWIVILRLAALMLMGGAFDLVIFRLKRELHTGDFIVGLVWGLGAVGDIAAGLSTPWLRRRLGFGACFLGGLLLLGGSIVIIGLNAQVLVFLGLGTILAFGDIVAQITSSSLVQEVTPGVLQGRVAAAIQTILYAGSALGAAISTFLAARLGSTPPVFVGMGLLILALPVLGFWTPARLRSPEQVKAPQG